MSRSLLIMTDPRLDEPLACRASSTASLCEEAPSSAVDGSGLKSDFATLLHHLIEELLVRSGRVAKKPTS